MVKQTPANIAVVSKNTTKGTLKKDTETEDGLSAFALFLFSISLTAFHDLTALFAYREYCRLEDAGHQSNESSPSNLTFPSFYLVSKVILSCTQHVFIKSHFHKCRVNVELHFLERSFSSSQDRPSGSFVSSIA